MKKLLLLLTSFTVLFSCVKEEVKNINVYTPSSDGMQLVIPIEDETSKAHWNADGKFIWDFKGQADAELITMVAGKSSYAKWKSGLLYNYTKVEDVTNNVAKLVPRGTLVQGSVSERNQIFCISPINKVNGASIKSELSKVVAYLPMPHHFENTNNAKNLSSYMYIYTNTQVKSIEKNVVTAEGAKFKNIPAALEVIFKNNSKEAKRIAKVVIKATKSDGTPSKIFPHRAICEIGLDNISVTTDTNTEKYSDSIVITVNDCKVESNAVQNFFAYALPVNNESEFNCKNLEVSVYSQKDSKSPEYQIYTSKKVNINFGKNSKKNMLCSGYKYSFEVEATDNNSKAGLVPFEEYFLARLWEKQKEIDISAYNYKTNETTPYNTFLNKFRYRSNSDMGSKYTEYNYFVGENFSSGTVSRDGSSYYTVIEPLYFDEFWEMRESVKQRIQEVLTLINDNMSDLEKVITISNWICNDIVYRGGALSRDEIENANKLSSAIVERSAVCLGYSRTFYTYMSYLGIDCDIICGTVGDRVGKTIAHAWNRVKIDGEWYLIDCTWGGGSNPYDSNAGGKFDYKYFLKTNYENRSPYNADAHKGLSNNPIYDNAFWKDIKSDIVCINGEAYYVSNSALYRHSLDKDKLSDAGTRLLYVNDNTSLAGYQGILYYTYNSSIMAYNPVNKDNRELFGLGSKYPRNLKICNGVMYYKVGQEGSSTYDSRTYDLYKANY